jgi:hypothetical protein
MVANACFSIPELIYLPVPRFASNAFNEKKYGCVFVSNGLFAHDQQGAEIAKAAIGSLDGINKRRVYEKALALDHRSLSE